MCSFLGTAIVDGARMASCGQDVLVRGRPEQGVLASKGIVTKG